MFFFDLSKVMFRKKPLPQHKSPIEMKEFFGGTFFAAIF